MSKKPYFILFVFGLLVVSAVIFNSLGYLGSQQEKEKKPEFQETEKGAALNACLVYAEGQVEYRGQDIDWQPARDGLNLDQGYAIRVVGEGKAIVSLDDGGAIRLNSDSHLVLDDMSSDKITLVNSQGEMYFRVAKTDKRVFEVKADDIIYEAQGTAYKVTNKEEERTLEVYQSKVKVKKEGEEEIIVEEGKRFCLKNTEDPGQENQVQDILQEELAKNEFLMWNKQKDLEDEAYQDELGILGPEKQEQSEETRTKKAEMAQESLAGIKSIVLSHSGNSAVSWQADGYSAKGFKLVWSKSPNPSFPTRPGDKYKQFDSPDASSAVTSAFDGEGTYYVRVCEYLGDKCGVYSNEIEVKLSK